MEPGSGFSGGLYITFFFLAFLALNIKSGIPTLITGLIEILNESWLVTGHP